MRLEVGPGREATGERNLQRDRPKRNCEATQRQVSKDLNRPGRRELRLCMRVQMHVPEHLAIDSQQELVERYGREPKLLGDLQLKIQRCRDMRVAIQAREIGASTRVIPAATGLSLGVVQRDTGPRRAVVSVVVVVKQIPRDRVAYRIAAWAMYLPV